MNKSALRKLYLQKRSALTTEEIEEASARIAEQFTKLSFSNVHYLHTFYPIVGKFEVDSLKVAEWIRIAFPQIKLVLSKSNFYDHSLSHYLWEEDTPLAMNSWGITEPESGELVSPKCLDMVLVPLLVFDKQGKRVGYGKGFYDRFLSQCRSNVLKVGLSYFKPIEKIGDADTYDIPLDICVTPDEIWYF
jgi:5-formyltetrahydrofolate cyclo-ligase